MKVSKESKATKPKKANERKHTEQKDWQEGIAEWRKQDHAVKRSGNDSYYVPKKGKRILFPGVTSKRRVIDMMYAMMQAEKGIISGDEYNTILDNIKNSPTYGRLEGQQKQKNRVDITEETPFPYYTFFRRNRYFLPLVQKMRKGQDLAGGSDSRWNSFVQLFNEAMNNGEIPTKSPPSGLAGHEPGTVEWTESEVFDLINDEMERSKDVQAKPVEQKLHRSR